MDTIAPVYAGWREQNIVPSETIGSLSDEELAWSLAPSMCPIWALAGLLAGTRAYWICAILNEPGGERTPFTDPAGEGWEDDLHPQHADDLVHALRSTRAVLDATLARWTPAMLSTEVAKLRNGVLQPHVAVVLMRLMTHDAAHTGEISQILGAHGRREIDLWSRPSRVRPS